MEPLLRSMGPVCAAAAELLVGSLWKGLVLVAGVALLLRALPRLSAAARSRVWVAVLLLLLLLPAFSLLLPAGAASAGAGREAGLVQGSAAWSFALAGVWALLSLLRLAQLGASAVRLRGIARRAVPVQAPEAIERLLGREARAVSLCVSADVGRPSVAGFLRPSILLPVGLLEELSAAEMEHVVLHELEHLRRRDDWTNLLQKLSLAVFPLHPALHWLDRRLCLERELACDDRVLSMTGQRKGYAACLARLAEESLVRRGVSLVLGLLGVRARARGSRSELSGRILRILRGPAVAMNHAQASLATAAVLGMTLGGSVLLARSPRLIGFAVPSAPALAAARPGELPAPEIPTEAVPGYRSRMAKAVMRQASATPAEQRAAKPSRRVLRAGVADSRRQRVPLRRIAYAEEPAGATAPARSMLLPAWRQAIATPHLTLTLATEVPVSRDSYDLQPSYAAVPVRGGWLLIRL